MSGRWQIHGFAIVSSDDCIAATDGAMPASLRNAADWRRFQAGLDACALVILGRRAHEAAPNAAGRPRVVMSRRLRGLVPRLDAWWWNPADLPCGGLLATLLPEGGRIGVPGGQGAFDHFLAAGFHEFHLSRAAAARLPGGIRLFSGAGSAEARLAAAGLAPGTAEVLDEAARVTLTIWTRKEPAP
jgi:hypothetical protein